MTLNEYNNTLISTYKSRTHLDVSAAYVNVAMRASPSLEELKNCAIGQINPITSRAFATMMNLAFAFEISMKGYLDDDLLEELGIGKVKQNQEGHLLRVLFGKLPKIEQDQLRQCVKDIMLIDDAKFDALMELTSNGFVEWRYFFEDKYAGKTYNYLEIVTFLYLAVYYFISNEGKINTLEAGKLRDRAFIGETGIFRKYNNKKKELEEALQIAFEDGNGTISPEDLVWIEGIGNEMKSIIEKISEIREQIQHQHAGTVFCADGIKK